MREVETVEEVASVLRELSAKRIGIDGADGAGKSRLARELARELDAPHLCLDDFLEKNRGGYIDFIKYNELRGSAASLGAVVIEGVCLLDVLSKADIVIDALVYVKRYHLGYWSDERELDLAEPLEDFLASERELLTRIEPGGELDGLGEEIIRYHYHRRPHNQAHVVYRRNDG